MAIPRPAPRLAPVTTATIAAAASDMDLFRSEKQFKANHEFVLPNGARKSEGSDGPAGSSSDEHRSRTYSSHYLGDQHVSLGEWAVDLHGEAQINSLFPLADLQSLRREELILGRPPRIAPLDLDEIAAAALISDATWEMLSLRLAADNIGLRAR